MQWLSELVALLGIKFASAAAGFIGSVISLRAIPEVVTWKQRTATVASGTAAAIFVAPLISGYFNIQSGAGEHGIAFLIGLYGMSFAAASIKWIRDGALWELIKARVGGGQ